MVNCGDLRARGKNGLAQAGTPVSERQCKERKEGEQLIPENVTGRNKASIRACLRVCIYVRVTCLRSSAVV
jgi:hypothetical protein